jgi:MarR family transcriptional regulator, organic hydroperoxide resistance regulator
MASGNLYVASQSRAVLLPFHVAIRQFLFERQESIVVMKQAERLSACEDGAQTVRHDRREAVPDNRLLAHLVKEVWRGLVRALQTRLADHGVSFGQWLFLRILWERDGITQRELSAEAGVMEPTTFQAVKTMEQLGYITRRRLPDSKKKVYIFLTPLGRSLQKKLVPLAAEVNTVAVRTIGAQDVSALRGLLLTIIDNLAADEAEGRAARQKQANDFSAEGGVKPGASSRPRRARQAVATR